MENFDEHLEKQYKFIINTNKNVGGGFGDVYFGSMYKENDVENKIPIVLKTCTEKAKNEQQQQFKKEQFKKEQEIFKMLSGLYQDNVVNCYGIAHIDDKEYMVMEDLKAQGFKTVEDVYNELIKEKSGNNKNIIKQYRINLNNLYDMSNIHTDYKKQKAEIKKHKQYYNEKFKQKEEKKPKQNESISYKEKVRCFFENTERFKELRNILELAIIFHNDIHEGNVMVNLEKCIIKLIDLGYSTKKDDEYLEDEECDYANKFDIRRYKYLKSAFYYLLGTDIIEEKQPSL